MKQQINLWWYL